MDGFSLPQGYKSHYEEAVYFLPLHFQKFLVHIWLTSEGWKAESISETPSDFEHRTPELGIQHLNHYAIATYPGGALILNFSFIFGAWCCCCMFLQHDSFGIHAECNSQRFEGISASSLMLWKLCYIV